MTEPRPDARRPAEQPRAPTGLRRADRRFSRSSAGSARRFSRAVFAFLDRRPRRRLRRATTRSSPTRRSSTARGSTGSTRIFATGASTRSTRSTSSRRCIITTHADPDRPRGRVRVPLRPLQHRRSGPVHRSGLIAANWVGVSFGGTAAACSHVLLASSSRRSAGAIWAGIAGLLKATVGRPRGDLDDHAQLDRLLVRRATSSGRAARSRTPDAASPISAEVVGQRQAARVLGRPGAPGTPRRLLHRARPRSSSSAILLNRTTLGYEVRAVGFNPDAAALRRDQRAAGATSWRWRSRARSPAWPARMDMLGYLFRFGTLDVAARHRRLPRHRGRAPRAQHRRRRRSRRAALRRAALRDLDAQPRPERLPPELAGNLTLMIQGLVVLFVGADLLILWIWNLRRKKRATLPRLREAAYDRLRRALAPRRRLGCRVRRRRGTRARRARLLDRVAAGSCTHLGALADRVGVAGIAAGGRRDHAAASVRVGWSAVDRRLPRRSPSAILATQLERREPGATSSPGRR